MGDNAMVPASNPSDFSMVLAPASLRANFCMVMEDDSMKDDRIFAGDVVYLRAQDSAEDGQIAVVLFEGAAHIGRYWRQEWGFILVPSNTAYQSKIFNTEDSAQIIGIAVGASITIVGMEDPT